MVIFSYNLFSNSLFSILHQFNDKSYRRIFEMAYLSIVIPAYNEASAIENGKLKSIVEWAEKQKFSTEVIVVDDGSGDATAALAKESVGKVLTIPHAGKAVALVTGIRQSCGERIIVCDMDQATPIREANKLLDALNGSEVAIGSRGLVRTGAPVGRYLLSWGQVFLRTVLLGLSISDTQCGFKGMQRSAALEIISKLHLYNPCRTRDIRGPSVTSGFDVEFLYVARRLSYRISEIPVSWDFQETRRVKLLRDAWRGIMDLLIIKAAALRGNYP